MEGDDLSDESQRVVMVKTTVGGGIGAKHPGLTVWKPQVRGGLGANAADHVAAALAVDPLRFAASASLSGSASSTSRPAPHPPHVAIGPSGAPLHTSDRYFVRRQHDEARGIQEGEARTLRAGDGGGVALPDIFAKRPVSSMVSLLPHLNLQRLSENRSPGASSGDDPSANRAHGAMVAASARGVSHTARPNAILPRFPALHAADTKLPPVAQTSREALAAFELRNDLLDFDTPPASPVGEVSSYEAFGSGGGKKRSMRGIRGSGTALPAGEGGPVRLGGNRASGGGQVPGGRDARGSAASEALAARRRRAKVLVGGAEQNPVFGLLCAVTPPQVAAAFDDIKKESRSVAAVGLDPPAFAKMLRKLVPHVDVSDAYAEKMFDMFESTTTNNQTKRIQFVDLLREYAQHAAPAETHRSLKFFFSLFEDADAKGFMPIRCLDGAAVRQFTASEVVGNAAMRWQKLATVLSLEKNVRQLVAHADQVLGHTRAHRQAGGGQLDALRKRTQLQEATATAASRQALQQALAATMITIEDLKHLAFCSPRLYAAFNDLWFPRIAVEQLVVGSSHGNDSSRPSSGGGRQSASRNSVRGSGDAGRRPNKVDKPQRKSSTLSRKSSNLQGRAAPAASGSNGTGVAATDADFEFDA